ncbi:MAG TPA: exodeoxyribonuclease VII large subunit [Jiangellales bacterium]|nr:exodeoxyribonuclease VII large subunit [Jiangellales bacterium]
MALQTSPERPAPVRVVSQAIGGWIERLGALWIEGQVAQLSRRPGARTTFLVLRDPAADLSLQVTCPTAVLDAVVPPLTEGARVVVHAKPAWYYPRGTISLAADEIRQVGLGELLARLERLRRLLATEGLFDADRKRSLPFLPRTVGLICGRASAAERDVLENARRRWPAVRFRVLEVAVQGPTAVSQVLDALRALDRDPEVEVVVLARGGGSVEDLLPFSDEALVRGVAACRTPVVSAIGHESDTPLVDLVADVRASTPTDAAERVVPDVTEELAGLAQARLRSLRALRHRLDGETSLIASLRSRPVLADPHHGLDVRAEEVSGLLHRVCRTLDHRLDRAADDLAHVRARVRALSPAATLERGYAVVHRADGAVVRSPAEVAEGEHLRLRLAQGELGARAEHLDRPG